jgi:hypothetical protein
MPHVRAVEGQNFIELDDGIVVRPNSFVNVDTTRPLAAAALVAKTIEALDAEPAPAPLSSASEQRYKAASSEAAKGLLEKSEFDFWLDTTPGATVLHIVAKDSAGTTRQATINLA